LYNHGSTKNSNVVIYFGVLFLGCPRKRQVRISLVVCSAFGVIRDTHIIASTTNH